MACDLGCAAWVPVPVVLGDVRSLDGHAVTGMLITRMHNATARATIQPTSPPNTFADLYVKPKMHDVTVLHDVFLAFGSHFAGFFGLYLATVIHVILVRNYFRTNKSTLKI